MQRKTEPYALQQSEGSREVKPITSAPTLCRRQQTLFSYTEIYTVTLRWTRINYICAILQPKEESEEATRRFEVMVKRAHEEVVWFREHKAAEIGLKRLLSHHNAISSVSRSVACVRDTSD